MGFTSYERRDVTESYSIHLCDLTVKDTYQYPPPAKPTLTINNPLDPPDAQRDDETDGVPGATGTIGHCGGHHGGQREDDDSSIKHLGKYTASSVLWHWGNDTAAGGPRATELMAPPRLYPPLLCSRCNPKSPKPRSWTPSEADTGIESRWHNGRGTDSRDSYISSFLLITTKDTLCW